MWKVYLGTVLLSLSIWAAPPPWPKFENEILPFQKKGRAGGFRGVRGMVLSSYTTPRPENFKGTVVIISGFSESYLHYMELMLDLFKLGYQSVSYDHRGQGFSQRLTDNPAACHLDSFDYYVDDMQSFMTSRVLEEPVYLISHSTGGLISTYYLNHSPARFQAILFSAPYFELNGGLFPEFLIQGITSFLSSVGFGETFAPGAGNFTLDSVPFEKNDLTHSQERYAAWLESQRRFPEVFISGPTNGWVAETVYASRHLPKVLIEAPVVLLQAGNDQYVRLPRQEKMCNEQIKCEKVLYPNAFHEILQETDDVRDDVLKRITTLFR